MESLKEIYQKFSYDKWGWGDKGTFHSYIDVYEKLLIKRENIKFLEIGVMKGHSAMMWAEYFKNSEIFCVDIENNLEFEEKGWQFILDDATRASFANKFENDFFDYIIDDGSHLLSHQINSFNLLFPKLKQEGLYIIEDIQNLDADLNEYLKLHKSCEILDLRHERPLKDNVMIFYKK